MAQLFTVNLGITGKAATLGYEFFDESGASLGARSTTGVTEFGSKGIYFRTMARPAGAVVVVWDDTDTGRVAVDDTIARPTTAAEIVTALLTTADTVENGVTFQAFCRAMLATMAGVATGGNTPEITFKNPAGGTTRVVMTVDADGNRSAVTLS